MLSLFPKNVRPGRKSRLVPITLTDFGGGMNVIENDDVMTPRFQRSLINLQRTPGKTQTLRFGNKYFVDVKNVATGNIVDMMYFSDAIVSVTSTGQIVKTDGAGVNTLIWSNSIAAALPGGPAGWSSSFTTVDFVNFKTSLIIHNGIDKPVILNAAHVVTYLADAASGSNVNVPIGKYGCVVSNYHCVAGIPAAPTTIYIGSVGTSGTFPGDPIPNDSISIDVGAFAPEGASEIRGIAGYRAFLLVFFRGQTLVVKLGDYSAAGKHIPSVPDTLPSFGLLGHRAMVQVENDLLFAGLHGVGNAKRNLFSTETMDSAYLSDLIEPNYKTVIGSLTNTQWLNSCFMIYDKLEHAMQFFMPGGISYVYAFNEKLRYRAWSRNEGVNWSSACVSFLGRVFLSSGTRIYQQGNGTFTGEAYYADKTEDRDVNWTPATPFSAGTKAYDTVTQESYTCINSHTSGNTTFLNDRTAQVLHPNWTRYEGELISFEMELPWISSRDPMQVKHLKFLKVGAKGRGGYTVEIFVDNLFKDDDGNEVFTPALSMDFTGDDTPGYGVDKDEHPYGGGRRGSDPRLWGFPVKFEKLKVRIKGTSRRRLDFWMIAFLYAKGKYRR
jgi:hypothetical protein